MKIKVKLNDVDGIFLDFWDFNISTLQRQARKKVEKEGRRCVIRVEFEMNLIVFFNVVFCI